MEMAGFEIIVETSTDPTGGDGVRHDKFSEWQTVTAPAHHVIVKDSVHVYEESANGDSHRIELDFSDPVKVFGTITQPQTIKARAYALGPSGYWSGRGWIQAKVTGEFEGPLPNV